MTDNLDLFDTGDARRDMGIAQVLEHERDRWKEDAAYMLQNYAFTMGDTEFTAQDFREWFTCEPKHPNAWGALFRNALKAGLIQATGRYRKSTAPASHSRMVQIYVGKA